MRLTKLHGLGNDFLVLLDDGSVGPVEAARVQALCHRHMGVGADGLIRSERLDGGAISFMLSNADGSQAEMSGNGARCLGLAAARAGWWPDRSRPLILQTPAGERRLDWQSGDLGAALLRVGMGVVHGGPAEGRPRGGGQEWTVDVGNPHAVALVDGPMPSRAELDVVIGAGADRNYEFVVRGPDVGALTLVVHERGAGWTQACGTGSVAAAWAAHQQGWVGRLVTVHNPGGTVQVDLSGPEAMLIGPAVFVAIVEVGRPGPMAIGRAASVNSGGVGFALGRLPEPVGTRADTEHGPAAMSTGDATITFGRAGRVATEDAMPAPGTSAGATTATRNGANATTGAQGRVR